MAHPFGSLVFTPVVQALQERHGSRRQYARILSSPGPAAPLGADEEAFIADRDSFYMASVGETGWPYVQHRGGPAGFLKVIDPHTIAFADFAGNKQFVSTGNLSNDGRVALILVDYPSQSRLKILGHARVIEGEAAGEWVAAVQDPSYKATVERVFVIHVDAVDWNCSQHITPRYTADEIKAAVAPLQDRVRRLVDENESLRRQLEQREPSPRGERRENVDPAGR